MPGRCSCAIRAEVEAGPGNWELLVQEVEQSSSRSQVTDTPDGRLSRGRFASESALPTLLVCNVSTEG